MTHRVCLAFLSIALIATLQIPAFSQATQPAAPREEPEEVRLSVGRPDEYDAVIADLGLTGDQLRTFREADARRIANLKAFVASEDGKRLIELREQLAAARREKRPASEVSALRAQITPLSDLYWEIRNKGRVELLSILTGSQLKQYVGFSLFSRTMRGLERLELAADQQQKARAIANDEAGQWFSEDVVKADPYFRGLLSVEQPTLDRIVAEVLNDDQRARLRRSTSRPVDPAR